MSSTPHLPYSTVRPLTPSPLRAKLWAENGEPGPNIPSMFPGIWLTSRASPSNNRVGFCTNETWATDRQTAPARTPTHCLADFFCIPRRDAVAILCNAQPSLAPVLSLLLRLYNVLVLCLEHSGRTEQMTWTGDLNHISTGIIGCDRTQPTDP